MWKRIFRIFEPRAVAPARHPVPFGFVWTEPCVRAVHDCLMPAIGRQHEGVAYLLGQTDGNTTVAVAAIRPEAATTSGSFDVTSAAMARVVRASAETGLQVVGQVHTHPGRAFHSQGDDQGAHIAYTGFVSIVIPDYGRHLPALDGIAAFVFRAGCGFRAIEEARITIAQARIQ